MSLGALITTYTPPATCVQSFSNLYINHTRDLKGPVIAGPLSASGCFPDNYDLRVVDHYYSPGICPVGYTAACSSSNTISGTRTETVITCCPSLMNCAPARYDWESTLPCTGHLQGPDQTTSVTYLDPENGRPTMIEPWTPLWYYGLGIQIRHESTDAQAAPTGNGSGPSNNNPGGGSNQGLSPGAAAGIGIGVTLLVLLVIGGAAGVCIVSRRARKRQQAQTSPPPPYSSPYETDGEGLPASAVFKTEIAGHQRPAELYPIHHEAAYGSQVHLVPQELEQPTRIHEAEKLPHAWSPPPQVYEMSPHPHPHSHAHPHPHPYPHSQPLAPPAPVYELERQHWRQQQNPTQGQGWAAPQSPGTWGSSWSR